MLGYLFAGSHPWQEGISGIGDEQKYMLSIINPFSGDNVGKTVSYQGLSDIKSAFEKGIVY